MLKEPYTRDQAILKIKQTGAIIISKFYNLTKETILEITDSAPYAAPADGTYWYYSSAADVDVMINNNGWKGYQNVSSDSRGYNLGNTDPAGVIVTATEPLTQSDASALVAGDLWLDSSDLANYPKIYRYTGTTWVQSTHQIKQPAMVLCLLMHVGTQMVLAIQSLMHCHQLPVC
jgi:hypothetical protein